MTDPDPHDVSGPEGLQFDEAEYQAPQPQVPGCVVCKQGIASAYYEANGKVFCETCHDLVRKSFTDRRGGFERFVRAVVFGLAVAVVGFGIYYGFAKLTGAYWSLISIIVGLMVGSAVKAGSRNRGGWVYQTLAVFLTYTALAAAYSAQDLPEIIRKSKDQGAAKTVPAGPLRRDNGAGANPAAGRAAAAPQPAPQPPVDLKNAGLVKTLLVGVGALVMLVVISLAIVYGIPIFHCIDSPISFLIIGIAFWEAWKLNKRPVLAFTGPFRVAPPEVINVSDDDVEEAEDEPTTGATGHG